jgi:hypothetical protein
MHSIGRSRPRPAINLKLTAKGERNSLFEDYPTEEEVLTDTLPRASTTRWATWKGRGNAIDDDVSRSSTWLHIEDFQRKDLCGRHRFGRACGDGFAGLGSHQRQ